MARDNPQSGGAGNPKSEVQPPRPSAKEGAGGNGRTPAEAFAHNPQTAWAAAAQRLGLLARPRLLWDRLRRSTMLYATLSTGVRVGANLVLVPIVVKKLRASELALWWTFLALGALA